MLYTGSKRGRGASANIVNRFMQVDYVPYGDAERLAEDDDSRPKTVYMPDASKSIIAYNDSPDVGFDASINPYRGCEHGCVYCYARPTHEYLDMSAGLDFETRIMVKHEAPELLRNTLSGKNWKPQVVGFSGVTDCYQPVERELMITRGCLEVFLDFRNPVVIITKNRLVTRDIDLLQELASFNAVTVFVSVTTLDLELNRVMEPRTSSPKQRLDTIHQLAEAGIPVGSLIAPVIPGLTDTEMPAVIEAVANAGATFASYIALRLPLAVAPLFETWLDERYPDKKEKVLNRVRSMRGGNLYNSEFDQRMKGTGFHADQLRSMFEVYTRKHGLNRGRNPLCAEYFRVPIHSGDQIELC